MATQDYQLRYWGPDSEDGRPDKGRRSFASSDTAIGNARGAAASRAVRCPASHVLVVDKTTRAVLFEWHGSDTAEGKVREYDPYT